MSSALLRFAAYATGIGAACRRVALTPLPAASAAACRIISTTSTAARASNELPFAEQFAESALYRAGDNLSGRVVEGTIVSAERESITVDIGLKFPARLNFGSDIHSNLRASCVPGAGVVVRIQDIERSEHLLGSDKHTSIHMATASFVNMSEN